MIDHDSERSLRVELRFKNANLLGAVEAQFAHLREGAYHRVPGIIRGAARAMGVSYAMLQGYIRLQLNPYSRHDGKLLPAARRIAEKLSLNPDEAFPPELYTGLFKNGLVQFVSPTRFLPLSSREARLLCAPEDLEEQAMRQERIDLVHAALQVLSERDRKILTEHHGLDGKPERTFPEITGEKVTTARVAQIHQRALARLEWLLSHPREVWSEKAASDGGAILLQKKLSESRLRGES